jgi:phosphoribosylanthranilate isomerase
VTGGRAHGGQGPAARIGGGAERFGRWRAGDPVGVKICGLAEPRGLDAAVAAGADLLGFVFVPRSPRAVTPGRAAALAARVPEGGPRRVGLFVDAPDEAIGAVLAACPLDALQLHGGETPARVAAVRARFGLPVIKAMGIGGAADVAAAQAYSGAADMLLLDARPPPGADRPGGHARVFDWGLLAGVRFGVPWLLAGGLTPGNVAAAIRATGAPGVDVSSGVESAPGVKDPARVAAFVGAARRPADLAAPRV